MAEVWSTDIADIEAALREPDGRVFRQRDGRLLRDMSEYTCDTGGDYIAYSCPYHYRSNGWILGYETGLDVVAVLMPVVAEQWSSDPKELETAFLSPEGRVFKTRIGDIVDDVSSDRLGYYRPTEEFPTYSAETGWYYKIDGRLYAYCESSHDIVSVRLETKTKQEPPVETTENPDFLRLLSFAKNEESAELIRREYHSYRLTETLHLKVLGFTGKRKNVSWEAASKLKTLLDLDAMCDSVPWIISEGKDIHDVFEQHRPGSCMRDSCKHELRQLYALNPAKVKTAHHAKGSHGLLQSAISCLVWYDKEKVYIDRRYSDGYLPLVKEPLIRSLARQLKAQTGKDVVLVWKGDDITGIDTTSVSVQFTLDRDCDLMPWCDSIRYVVEYDDDTVTLSTSEKGGRMCCQDQSGTDITESLCKCCSCHCSVDEDNCRMNESGNTYCDDCYSDHYSYCNWNEEDYSADDVSEARIYSYGSSYQHRRSPSSLGYRGRVASWATMSISDRALSDHFTELQDRSYCHNDLVVEDNRGNYYAPDDEGSYVVTEDGETYHPDDVCETIDGETHPKENCQELHDGTWCLSEYAVEIDGEWYHDDARPEPDDSSEDSEDEDTEEPQQEQQTTEDGYVVPDGYRLAVLGEILPPGSRYLFVYGYNGASWDKTGEAGKPYGETSWRLRLPYIIPVDRSAFSFACSIPATKLESSVSR